ncbi:MAG: aldose epimerase family protein [Sedimentisphaerales bacterium]|jgi:aldose 1-epimerase
MNKKIMVGAVLMAVAFYVSSCCEMKCCAKKCKEPGKMSVKTEPFGKTTDGQQVDIVTLTNGKGLTAKIMTYGGTIVSFEAPDRNGKPGDIVLGFDNLDGYLKGCPYFGAIIGRYGNRIAAAKFTLDGKEYKLAANNGENSLHGGIVGFDKVVWKIEKAEVKGNKAELKLSCTSRDGEEGFPGNLKCVVTYTLTSDNKLEMKYEATTDKPTVLNMTNHSYWNLAGAGSGDVLGHELMINADKYTPVDKGLIPTGELKSVKDTPLDFTKPMTIGSRIKQITDIGGYDHNFALNGKAGKMKLAAKVYEPTSGRVMEIQTTEPGVQFYSAIGLDGSLKGKDGKIYNKYGALCLETQHYPDSPNKPMFPSTVLRPGEKYETITIHTFSTK